MYSIHKGVKFGNGFKKIAVVQELSEVFLEWGMDDDQKGANLAVMLESV